MSWAKKGKKKNKVGGQFLALPHAVLKSVNFTMLSAKAVKLLIDIAVQYSGTNNGNLQAAWAYMEKRGWKSRDTLGVALKELLHYGFIEKTRQGNLYVCSLYALTWHPIHLCNVEYDIGIKPSPISSGKWQPQKRKFVAKKKNASTEFVIDQHDSRDDGARMAA